MRVGLAISSANQLASVNYVARCLLTQLRGKHSVELLPAEFNFASPLEQRAIAARFVDSCDVLVGFYNSARAVLRARHECESRIRCVLFLLGSLPRGGHALDGLHPLLRDRDVLVVNNASDAVLCERFFLSPTVRLLPLGYDTSVYFRERPSRLAEVRATVGLEPAARVVLYVGRLNIEKNVHSVLRVARAAQEIDPRVHILLAGSSDATRFAEFGVIPVNVGATLKSLSTRLGFARGTVRFVGQVTPERLRGLYAVADVLLNLSLNHDENFGLSKVEAMACGTPTVTTDWGGFKDTGIDGVTGVRVGTAVTPLGVKIDWPEAVRAVLDMVRHGPTTSVTAEACASHARRYSLGAFRTGLLRITEEAAADRDTRWGPLTPTDFARRVWRARIGSAPIRPGSDTFEMYEQWIGPYVRPGRIIPLDSPMQGAQQLFLSGAMFPPEGASVRIDDPLFPFRVDIPSEFRAPVAELITRLRRRPVSTVSRLLEAGRGPEAALRWMASSALVLRARGTVDFDRSTAASDAMTRPLFAYHHLSTGQSDFLVC